MPERERDMIAKCDRSSGEQNRTLTSCRLVTVLEFTRGIGGYSWSR